MGFANVDNITSAKQKETSLLWWSEHDNATKDFELARHLNKHFNHVFTWKILCHASKKTDTRKDLEAIFVALLKQSLNEQWNFERLIFLKNGIT